MVRPGHAIADRADEEGRPHACGAKEHDARRRGHSVGIERTISKDVDDAPWGERAKSGKA